MIIFWKNYFRIIVKINFPDYIEESFKIYYHNGKYDPSILDLILGVAINSNIQKEDIYIKILFLL